MENKKRIYTQIKNFSVYKSVFGNLFASILKFKLAVAIFLMFALVVNAGDVVVQSGQLDVDGKLVVDAAGNVGIGTTSPGPEDRLYVNSGSNTRLVINAPDTNQASLEFKKGGVLKWQEYVTSSSNDLRFFDGSSVVMTLEDGGDVGIGTTTPGAILHVKGPDTGAGAGIRLERDGFAGSVVNLVTGRGAGNDFGLEVGGSERLRIKDNGNVGIGTTSPTTKLVVDEDTDAFSQIRIDSGLTAMQYSAIDFADRGTNFWGIGKNTDNNFYIDETTVTPSRFFIERVTGNVGIGTITPLSKLDVSGTVRTPEICDEVGLNCKDVSDGWSNADGHSLDAVDGSPTDVVFVDNSGRTEITHNADTLRLEGTDHTFIEFYPDGPAIRKGYLGFPNAGENNIRITNEIAGGHVILEPTGGNVGIGNTGPTYKLDVVSNGANTARFGTAAADQVTIGNGAAKLNVGTIDPVYTIDGTVYATYMSSMPGVKEEVTGVMQLEFDGQNYKAIIDFDNLEKGSDMWLFSKVIDENIENIAILLTPNAAAQTWYKKDNNERTITIYSDKASEVSYRFTAPRFDYEQWSNLHEDQELKGFVI